MSRTLCAKWEVFFKNGVYKKRKRPLTRSGLFVGGANRTRTCDPIDVNDVLYQLSHGTNWEQMIV